MSSRAEKYVFVLTKNVPALPNEPGATKSKEYILVEYA